MAYNAGVTNNVSNVANVSPKIIVAAIPPNAISNNNGDFKNDRKPTLYEKDIAQWANKHQIFKSCEFADFSPRKGFKCDYYLKQLA